jgi:O-antigen ligase
MVGTKGNPHRFALIIFWLSTFSLVALLIEIKEIVLPKIFKLVGLAITILIPLFMLRKTLPPQNFMGNNDKIYLYIFITLLAMGSIFIWQFLICNKGKYKTAVILSLLSALPAIYFANIRVQTFMLVMTIIAAAILHVTKNKIVFKLICILSLCGTLFTAFMFADISKGASTFFRQHAWEAAVESINNRPVLGYGLSNKNISQNHLQTRPPAKGIPGENIDRTILSPDTATFHSHSQILQSLLNGGIIRLVAFCLLWAAIFSRLYTYTASRLTHANTNIYKTSAFICIIFTLLAFDSLFNVTFYNTNRIFLCIISGAGIAITNAIENLNIDNNETIN